MFRRLTAAAMALVAVASLSMPAHAADPPTSTVPFANGSNVYNEAVFNDGSHFWVEHLVGGWTGSAWKAWSVDPATGAGLVLNSQEHTDLQALLQALATPLLPMGAANSANQQLVVSGLGQLHSDLTGGSLLTASQLGAAGLATAAGQAQAHTDAQAIATAAASPALPATAPTLANQQVQVTAEQASAAAAGTQADAVYAGSGSASLIGIMKGVYNKVGGGGSVTGSVSITNFPAAQPVSGSVSVSNLPATQPVSGTVALSNTAFGQNCAVVAADQAYTAGQTQGCTMTTTGRVKVGLSSAATTGATASTTPDLAGAVDGGGLQQPLHETGGSLQTVDANSAAIQAAENANVFSAPYTTVIPASQTVSGTWLATGLAAGAGGPDAFFNATAVTDQTGSLCVDLTDVVAPAAGSAATLATACQTISPNVPIIMRVPVLATGYRWRLVNGATAETVLRVSSSFTRN